MRQLEILALACLMLSGASCDRPAEPVVTGRLEAIATIFPIADVLARLGGDRLSVSTLLTAGQSPHDFEPTAQQAEEISRCDLLVMVGAGIDEWASRTAGLTGRKRTILRLAHELDLDAAEDHGHDAHGDHAHHHDGGDGHFWLDPVLMRRAVEVMAEELIRLDPAGEAVYRAGQDDLLSQLDDLDHEYRTALAGVTNRNMVTLHAAYDHPAARYGLVQKSLYTADAADIGPQAIEEMISFIRLNNVRAVFIEPQFPAEKLQSLAERTGARILVLDPLGNAATEGYDGYFAMMRSNLRVLAEGLNEP